MPVTKCGMNIPKKKSSIITKGFLINELATFKQEVQFDYKDMVRNIIYSTHSCMFHSIFFRKKNQGIKSDTAQQYG